MNDEARREPSADSIRRAGLIVHSEDLFGGDSLVLIKHKNDWYRLMITKQGKLILTK